MRDLGIKTTAGFFLLASCLVGLPAQAQWAPAGITTYVDTPVSDGSGALIYATRLNPNLSAANKRTATGAVQWSTVLSSSLNNPNSAASDRSGGVVYAAGGSTLDIFAIRVNAVGGTPWGVGVTVCNAVNGQNQAQVATDAAGNSFFVWHDERNGGGSVNQYFAQKLDLNGVPQWTANGVQIISPGIVPYTAPTAVPVPDEAGGCYFVWEDSRAGSVGVSDLYAQRITSAGAPAWTANGVPICVAADRQFFPRAIPDGSGGLIALWMDRRNGADYDLYAQRLDNTGASQWTANGISIASAAGDQNQPVMIADGSGGAFMIWTDGRNQGVTGNDIYAQHIDGTGAALWTANGTVVTNSPLAETDPNIVSDGSGGVIVAWSSSATSPPSGRAGHLNASGASTWESGGVEFPTGPASSPFTPTLLVTDGLGGAYIGSASSLNLSRVTPAGEQAWVPNYRATISSVTDVNADEGGWVTVNTSKPLSDGSAVTPTTNGYSLWRKRVTGATTTRLSDDRHVLPTTTRMAVIAKYSDFPPGQWDAVAYTPAIVAPSYSLLAPTHTDSSFQSMGTDSFLVVAHTTSSSIFVVSGTAGGHSVDNLAPGAPQNFDGGYSGGTTVQLHWSPNSEADLWHYSVYKGTLPSFVPAPGNRIGQPTAASFQDNAYEPGVSHYKVSAVDRHGNESGYTLLSPSQITSVPPGTIPTRSYLAASAPNPFHSATAIEYGLAHDTKVSLVIYDLRGRRITKLVDGLQTAGVRRAIWSGMDDAHRPMPTGVYMVRFVAGDVVENEKIVRTN